LQVERKDYVTVLTLTRPGVLNALNPALVDALHAALDEIAGDAETRAVVLTGAGRGFCSGADLAAREGPVVTPRRPLVELGWHIRQVPQPVIAAVNGVAAGAGLSLAIAADVRIAAESARFSSIFIKRSFVPDTCVSYFLPRLIGYGLAAEMTLTGRLYDAQWALRAGLVNAVAPAEQVLSEAEKLAREIAANPPLAVRATKRLLYREENLEKVLEQEGESNRRLTASEDHQEAILAFLEKRQGFYVGK
jgi:2-(1,2-epoxy-1,2-dihydrophenyl)acetyl-CoA isomerase